MRAGGQGGERQRCEGIHNEVHPEHLCHGEGRFLAEEGSYKDGEACHDIDRHLEQDEALDIQVE